MTLLSVEKLSPEAEYPVFATAHSACMDIMFHYAGDRTVTYYTPANDKGTIKVPQSIKELDMPPGYRFMVPTGIKLIIPAGHHVKVYSRSSLALKKGLVLVNSVGIIDEDFDEELKILLMNVSQDHVSITEGDRIAQMEVVNTQSSVVLWDENLKTAAQMRKGGFGSTGE